MSTYVHPAINLLPWRDNLRGERRRQLVIWVVLVAIFAALVIAVTHLVIANKIARQESRNELLKQEITLLDDKIKQIDKLKKQKQNLLARIEIIDELQQSRFQDVKFFDELINVLPDGVIVSNISRRNGHIVIKGRAESNTRVSALMRKIELSNLVEQANLAEIRVSPQLLTHPYEFRLTVEERVKLSENSVKKSADQKIKKTTKPGPKSVGGAHEAR